MSYFYNPYHNPQPQTADEMKETKEIIPYFATFLYNHAKMRGSFTCVDSKNEKLYIMNKKSWTPLREKGYQSPYLWIRDHKKTFYIEANPRDKHTGMPSGFVQIAIPCHGEKYHIDELLKVIKGRKDIPNPTYVINDRHVHFTLVYMLKESVAPTMEQAIRGLMWSVAEKIVQLENVINQTLSDKDYTFYVEEDQFTTCPKLRLPGSYNDGRMVKVHYPKKTKQYTYHEMLQCLGIRPPYNARFQIQNMKKSIDKIRQGKWLDHYYLKVDKKIVPAIKLDIFIQMFRIHALEKLMIDGYDRMTEQEYVTEYCRLLCHVHNVWCVKSVEERKEQILGRMIEVIMFLTNDYAFQNSLFQIAKNEVMIQFDFNMDSYLDYEKMEKDGNCNFSHLKRKSQINIYHYVKNDTLIKRYHLDPDGSWMGKVYLNPTREKELRKPKVYIKDKIQNQMIAIARLTLKGLKNSEIMKKLGINKDRFFDRKRRINKEGGMKTVADTEFCFKHWPEQKDLKTICPHPNSGYYKTAEVAAA